MNGFSGQILFERWSIGFYNVVNFCGIYMILITINIINCNVNFNKFLLGLKDEF